MAIYNNLNSVDSVELPTAWGQLLERNFLWTGWLRSTVSQDRQSSLAIMNTASAWSDCQPEPVMLVFTALHGMQTRSGLTMRMLSVRLSVCQTRALWQNGIKICPDLILYERSLSLVFSGEWLEGVTPSTWNFVSTGPRWSEIADFEPTFAHSASAVSPSEKSINNTSRKSTMCFSTSLRWSSYVAYKPPGPAFSIFQSCIFSPTFSAPLPIKRHAFSSITGPILDCYTWPTASFIGMLWWGAQLDAV